jgi:hypothetical protein
MRVTAYPLAAGERQVVSTQNSVCMPHRSGGKSGLQEISGQSGVLKGAAMGFHEDGFTLGGRKVGVKRKTRCVLVQSNATATIMLDEDYRVFLGAGGRETGCNAGDDSLAVMRLNGGVSEHAR